MWPLGSMPVRKVRTGAEQREECCIAVHPGGGGGRGSEQGRETAQWPHACPFSVGTGGEAQTSSRSQRSLFQIGLSVAFESDHPPDQR